MGLEIGHFLSEFSLVVFEWHRYIDNSGVAISLTSLKCNKIIMILNHKARQQLAQKIPIKHNIMPGTNNNSRLLTITICSFIDS